MLRRILLVTLTLSIATTARAWGPEGHHITGYIATRLLTTEARACLRDLGLEDLAAVATYMDEERPSLETRFPHSSRWHYDNRSICESAPPSEFCKHGDCASYQIERWRNVLVSPASSREDRRNAVRFLVHMLGDMHQPLHMADHDDRGGNDLYVWLPREREARRLHEVWDSRLVNLVRARRAEPNYARELAEQYANDIAIWQRGGIEDWARESHDLAVNSVYADLPGITCNGASKDHIALSQEYIERGKRTVPIQLAKAGARIAAVLNQISCPSARSATAGMISRTCAL